MPVRLENDARLALRGEMYAGAARGCRRRRDVHSRYRHRRRRRHGRQAAARCPQPGRRSWRPCSGTVQRSTLHLRRPWLRGIRSFGLVAAAGLPRMARLRAEQPCQTPHSTSRPFSSSAAANDTVATEVLDHCLTVWGMMTVAAVHSFDPNLIVFRRWRHAIRGPHSAVSAEVRGARARGRHGARPGSCARSSDDHAAALGVPHSSRKEPLAMYDGRHSSPPASERECFAGWSAIASVLREATGAHLHRVLSGCLPRRGAGRAR